MHGIEIFRNSNTRPDAGAIACGIRMGLVYPSIVCEYAEWLMNDQDGEGCSDELVEMLIFKGGDKEALRCLEEHGFRESDNSARYLRYVLLSNLQSAGHELLEEIEGIYATFDYPEDMEPCIYYMSSGEDEGSEESVLSRFDNFMIGEKNTLDI